MARALLAAASIVETGELDAFRDDRYAGMVRRTRHVDHGGFEPCRPARAGDVDRRADPGIGPPGDCWRTWSPDTSSEPAELQTSTAIVRPGCFRSSSLVQQEVRSVPTADRTEHRCRADPSRLRRQSEPVVAQRRNTVVDLVDRLATICVRSDRSGHHDRHGTTSRR